MSELSLMSLLSGNQGTGLEGLNSPMKSEEAKLTLAQVDGELLTPEMRKALEAGEVPSELASFEALLAEEKLPDETSSTKNLLNPRESSLAKEGGELLNADESSLGVAKSKLSVGSFTGESASDLSKVKAETEATKMLAPEVPVKGEKAKLQLLSSEDFIEQKNALRKDLSTTAKTSNKDLDLLEGSSHKLATEINIKPQGPVKMHNPFASHDLSSRGGLALSGALFREMANVGTKEEENQTGEVVIEGASPKASEQALSQLALTKNAVNETSSASKPVLDLSHINAQRAGDLINEISNYIDRSRLESQGEIDVWVHHKDLGSFQVQAAKGQGVNGALVDLKIETFAQQGGDFFNKNAPELVKHLQDAGIKISDFQIKNNVHATLSQMSDSSSGQGGRDSQSSGQQQGQSSGFSQGQADQQGSSGEERRKQMWQHYQETYRQRFAS